MSHDNILHTRRFRPVIRKRVISDGKIAWREHTEPTEKCRRVLGAMRAKIERGKRDEGSHIFGT